MRGAAPAATIGPMPPHCDSMDGPVVTAARDALDAARVELVLPYVPEAGEAEVRRAFDAVSSARQQGPAAREVADLHFYETVVRIHRAGEGAPYTGLKPAGLDVGPVIPVAERAIATGSAEELIGLLCRSIESEATRRVARVVELGRRANGDVAANREYVEAMLGLQVWAHKLHQCVASSPHEAHGHAHGG